MPAYWRVSLSTTHTGHAEVEVRAEITTPAQLSQFIAKLEAVSKFLPEHPPVKEQSA